MNSKCYEIIKELVSLDESELFSDLKHESIFEEVGLSSSSENEKKVYKHDEEIVQTGFKLVAALLRSCFINDDLTLDPQYFRSLMMIRNIAKCGDINCIQKYLSECIWLVINSLFVSKNIQCKDHGEYCDLFDSRLNIVLNKHSIKEVLDDCNELIETYKKLPKVEALNLAIRRNYKWRNFSNMIFKEENKIWFEEIKLEPVSEEDRNNVEDSSIKCMKGMTQNFIDTMKNMEEEK